MQPLIVLLLVCVLTLYTTPTALSYEKRPTTTKAPSDQSGRMMVNGKKVHRTTTTTPAPPPNGKKKPTTSPVDDDDETQAVAGGDRPAWTQTVTTTSPKCAKLKCKPPPDVQACQPINVYDKSIAKPTGATAECCTTFKCTKEDGSFYPFHGLLGSGPVVQVASDDEASKPTPPPDTDVWKSTVPPKIEPARDDSEDIIEVNVIAVGTEDAVANAIEGGGDIDAAMFDMEAQMAKEMANMEAMTADFDNMMKG